MMIMAWMMAMIMIKKMLMMKDNDADDMRSPSPGLAKSRQFGDDDYHNADDIDD